MSVITIARQFGAGGKTLGGLVANRLGYTLVDEEIVELISQEANVSTDWVESISREMGSEKYLTRIMYKFGPFRKGYVNVSMETNPGYFDGNLYISLLYKIIPQIAAQDNVVISILLYPQPSCWRLFESFQIFVICRDKFTAT